MRLLLIMAASAIDASNGVMMFTTRLTIGWVDLS